MRLCRQPTEATPVRSTVIDNIAAKSESGMKLEEVRDREQRKQTWHALSDTAVTAWKAMFSKPKRQRAERAPFPGFEQASYPASMYEALMVRHSAVPCNCARPVIDAAISSTQQMSKQHHCPVHWPQHSSDLLCRPEV